MSVMENNKVTKPSGVLTFIRDKIIPFNAVITLCCSVAAAIDFFMSDAPKVLWIIAFIFGLAMLVIVVMPRLRPERMPQSLASSLAKYHDGQGKRQVISSAVYLSIGVLVFSGAAFASSKHKDTNGFIGALIPHLASMQSQMRNIENGNKKIIATLDKVKKETSDNPRKELNNRGITWKHEDFGNAVRSSDIETVKLFLQGGMQIRADDARTAVSIKNDSLLELFTAYSSNFFSSDCRELLVYSDASRVSNSTDPLSRFVRSVCGNEQGRAIVKELLASTKARNAAYQGQFDMAAKWKKAPQKCIDDVLNSRGPSADPAAIAILYSYQANQRMAEAKRLAARICDDYIKEWTSNAVMDAEMKKWSALSKLLS